MVKELLERRTILFEIAEVLYGEFFVGEDEFWGSPTEKELQEVNSLLDDYGYADPAPTDEQIQAAKLIAKRLGFDLNGDN